MLPFPNPQKKTTKKTFFCAKIPLFFWKNPGWECICKSLNRSCSSNLFSSSFWKIFPKGILGDVAATEQNSKQHQRRLFSVTLGKKKNTKNNQTPLFFCFLCSARRTLNPDGSWNSRKYLGMRCVLSLVQQQKQLFCCPFAREKNFWDFFQGFYSEFVSRTILSGVVVRPKNSTWEFWIFPCPCHGWRDELLSLLTV